MPGLTAEAEAELAQLSQNLHQVQDKFLQQWTGESLQRFLKDNQHRQVVEIKKTKDGIEEIKQEIESLKRKAENDELAVGEQRQKFQRLKQTIENTDKEVEQLLFQKEEQVKTLEKGATDLQEQKELLEAQDRATKRILQELNKAEGLYKDWLGLKFKNIGGGRLQFAFSRIDPNDHDRVFFFTLKIDDNKYQVTEHHPTIEGLEEMAEKLNASNNLMEFVVGIRRKFKQLV
ncbi:kinetochore protein Spc25-like [Amphiura filiformis]|uniref:kinetochore protein Spc25-like n=1 Tax=Amphiura filiformis TaxID=82378 RepID=UPI003B216655